MRKYRRYFWLCTMLVHATHAIQATEYHYDVENNYTPSEALHVCRKALTDLDKIRTKIGELRSRPSYVEDNPEELALKQHYADAYTSIIEVSLRPVKQIFAQIARKKEHERFKDLSTRIHYSVDTEYDCASCQVITGRPTHEYSNQLPLEERTKDMVHIEVRMPREDGDMISCLAPGSPDLVLKKTSFVMTHELLGHVLNEYNNPKRHSFISAVKGIRMSYALTYLAGGMWPLYTNSPYLEKHPKLTALAWLGTLGFSLYMFISHLNQNEHHRNEYDADAASATLLAPEFQYGCIAYFTTHVCYRHHAKVQSRTSPLKTRLWHSFKNGLKNTILPHRDTHPHPLKRIQHVATILVTKEPVRLRPRCMLKLEETMQDSLSNYAQHQTAYGSTEAVSLAKRDIFSVFKKIRNRYKITVSTPHGYVIS